MLNAIERYIKQAIVDRNALVASSALVSGIHLIKNNPEIVRRWVNEVQEAVNSTNDMVQYHGVSLLYQIRQHDKLAVSKFITQLQKTNLRSSLATCLLIRYTAALLRENANGQDAAPLYAFLQKMLRQKNEVRLSGTINGGRQQHISWLKSQFRLTTVIHDPVDGYLRGREGFVCAARGRARPDAGHRRAAIVPGLLEAPSFRCCADAQSGGVDPAHAGDALQ